MIFADAADAAADTDFAIFFFTPSPFSPPIIFFFFERAFSLFDAEFPSFAILMPPF